jgi:hypothetical protein
MASNETDEYLRGMLMERRIGEADFTTLCQLLASERSCMWPNELVEPGSAVTIRAPIQPKPHQLRVVWKVFNTAELLGAILNYLPSNELFKVRGVCHGFRHAIESGLETRIRMFIQSPPNDERPVSSAEHFPYRWEGTKPSIYQAKGQRKMLILFDPKANAIDANPILSHSKILRSVLLAQPAPKTCDVQRICSCGDFHELQIDSEKDGVNLGQVFDAVRRVGKCLKCGYVGMLRLSGALEAREIRALEDC